MLEYFPQMFGEPVALFSISNGGIKTLTGHERKAYQWTSLLVGKAMTRLEGCTVFIINSYTFFLRGHIISSEKDSHLYCLAICILGGLI